MAKEVVITRVQAVSYKVPQARTFRTARGTRGGDVNFFLLVRAASADGMYASFAEGLMPSLSGAGFPERSWSLLMEACRRLEGATVQLDDIAGLETVAKRIADELKEEYPDAVRTGLRKAVKAAPDDSKNADAAAKQSRNLFEAKGLAKSALSRLAISKEKPPHTVTAKSAVGPVTVIRRAMRDALVTLRPLDVTTDEATMLGKMKKAKGAGIVSFYDQVVPNVRRFASFPALAEPRVEGRAAPVYDDVEYLRPLGGNGSKGHMLERQALAYGLSTTRFSKGVFVAQDAKGSQINFKWSRSPISSGVSLALTTHKEATRARLRRAGVPMPRGRIFKNGDYESAVVYAERIGYPVVCKPATGVRGIGVFANIQDVAQLRQAFRLYKDSQLGGDDFIIEKHVYGGDYRIVVLDGEVLAAILREPASVVGDGESAIAQLIMHKNMFRRLNPHLWARPIKYDEATKLVLERANLSLASVPEKGQRIVLANSCSLSQGGDSIDVLDEMHPSIKDAAVRAVHAIPGLRYCGVDFLIEDHRVPLDGQSAGICELNAHAAIGNCEYPMFGTPREVARKFLRRCAELRGLEISASPADSLTLRLTIRGKVTGVGYRAWLSQKAKEFGISCSVRNVNTRKVEAYLSGPTVPVSALAAAAVLGPSKALPTSVTTKHVAAIPHPTAEVA